MDEVLKVISSQVPDLVALLIIVVVFIRSMEKRDALLLLLIKEVRALTVAMSAHAIESTAAIQEMRRVSKLFKPKTM